MTKYKILPAAWVGEKKRTVKRSVIILAILMGISFLGYGFLVFKASGAPAAILIGAASLCILAVAVGGGLVLGLFLRKSMFADGSLQVGDGLFLWKDISVRGKVKLSDIASAQPNEDGISVTLKTGKRIQYPGPVENQDELLRILRSGSA